jgi:DNA-binding IclR family transcriptional regulator
MSRPETNEAVRPVAGPHYKHCAALKPGGRNRLKVLALVAAYRDAGRESVATHELATHLELDPRKIVLLAKNLQSNGYLTGDGRAGPWRLPRRIRAEVRAAQKAAGR